MHILKNFISSTASMKRAYKEINFFQNYKEEFESYVPNSRVEKTVASVLIYLAIKKKDQIRNLLKHVSCQAKMVTSRFYFFQFLS